MNWQDILKRELGKALQADILEYVKNNSKTTVNNIHSHLKKRGLKPKRLKLFLDNQVSKGKLTSQDELQNISGTKTRFYSIKG